MELLFITMVMGVMGSTIRGAVLTLSVNWSKRQQLKQIDQKVFYRFSYVHLLVKILIDTDKFQLF